MSGKGKIALAAVLITAGAVGLRLYNTREGAQKPPLSKSSVQKTAVKAVSAQKGDLDLVLSYVGSLKARDEAGVFSKVSGKLVRYDVGEGDAAAKGQVVALIDRDETGLKYELAPVESPIAGIVGKIMLDKGATVQAAGGVNQGTLLAVIVDMDEMLVRLNIAEQDIPYFQKGLPANISVDAYPKETFAGEVSRISQILDAQTRTLPVEIRIPNPGHRLKSGMFCRIYIKADRRTGIIVLAQDALVEELGHNYVFVVDKGTARKKKVALGIRDDGKVEVLSGVQEGDQVIVFGQQGLKDGAQVIAAEETSAGPSQESAAQDQQGARE